MIITSEMLIKQLKEYADPFGKIRRMCEENKLFPIVRGLYETDETLSGYLLAPVIYGPSYLSFYYALSRYGLIPEAVREYTSATCEKGKKKQYSNYYGDYSYRDIPLDAYPFEIILTEENGYAYYIASPEKSLCDTIYTMPKIKNQKEMEQILFNSLRIEPDELNKLDKDIISALTEKYHSNNVRLMEQYFRRHL